MTLCNQFINIKYFVNHIANCPQLYRFIDKKTTSINYASFDAVQADNKVREKAKQAPEMCYTL
jgi:hypothetical protein